MANPAPTINNISAFDATVGTIIDFNIVGGTEIVRSNRVYIYDVSDNSLICSHTYVNTDSINELPPNTDSSIVYASGKSSADFVNGRQYYLRMQTFTNDEATQGSSAMSNAYLFWCLNTPTLAFSTIPSTITTTSYTVEATYTANISTLLDVTNAPQQYEFILYTSTGAQVTSSGVIIGSGDQIGTTDVYDLSYNFLNLENGASYYVMLTVYSTEGMSITTQSGTFYVNAGGTTLGAATAVNNACGGYISIISNLSSDYTSSITKVLVKRKEVLTVSTDWLTLYSIPIHQASDMNFTVVDFYNVYGRDYVYAIVPVFLQQQTISGQTVYVEVEGGYTQSNEVKSLFDGVFVADNTGIQKFVAGVNYGTMELHQATGVIETIGSKYPIIVSNSNLNYHTGSIGAYALGDSLYQVDPQLELDYLIVEDGSFLTTATGDYFVVYVEKGIGELNREEIAALRKQIGQFLTNKSPKIIKDWNGNIFLVMFNDNITFEFVNEWGMGLVTFAANWTEIGQADNQNDLEYCGLINIGGV